MACVCATTRFRQMVGIALERATSLALPMRSRPPIALSCGGNRPSVAITRARLFTTGGLALLWGGDRRRGLEETLAAFIEDAASLAEENPRFEELDRSAAHNRI